MNDQRTASAIYSIWWQVALGVFLALSMHTLIEAAWARYQLRQLEHQLTTEVRKISTPFVDHSRGTQPVTIQPIGPNERCIEGRRFERVNNGWRQINTPC